jgi:hypothetical protein
LLHHLALAMIGTIARLKTIEKPSGPTVNQLPSGAIS